jgi:hypothetical protein
MQFKSSFQQTKFRPFFCKRSEKQLSRLFLLFFNKISPILEFFVSHGNFNNIRLPRTDTFGTTENRP